jgi:hypothetical protein
MNEEIIKPKINPKYQGIHIVALVKEKWGFAARGTFEYKIGRYVTIFTSKVPRNSLLGMIVERFKFEQTTERMQREYNNVLALYVNVGDASAELISNALNRLNAGEKVDLESLLK